MEYSTFFELTIRQAFRCDRHGVYFANTDIYRAYQVVVDAYEDALNNNKATGKEDLCFNAGYHTGVICTSLKTAIYKVMHDDKITLQPSQYEVLEKCQSTLNGRPTKFDIEGVIDTASELFSALGLKGSS